MKNTNEKRFDVFFDDESSSNNKGFKESFEFCKNYIDSYNGSEHSYFADYKGGCVSIIDTNTYELIYTEEIPE